MSVHKKSRKPDHRYLADVYINNRHQDHSGAGLVYSLKLNFFYRLPLVSVCLFIFWHSSGPSSLSGLDLFLFQDKVMHFGAWAVIGFLAARNLAKEKPGLGYQKIWLYAFLFGVLYGIFDEIHQSFTPERFTSFSDLLADTLGSSIGAWCFISLTRFQK